MTFSKLRGARLVLLSVMLMLALMITACDSDDDDIVEEPAISSEVVEEDAEVAVVEVEEDAEVAAEAEVESDVDVVETTVDTEVITDTDVITETEVMTETEAVEIVTETTVMTDTDIAVETSSDVDTATTVEKADVDTEVAFAIIVLVDEAGNEVIADAAEQRPLFTYTGNDEGLIVDADFEAVEYNEDLVLGEGVDDELLGWIDNDGLNQLTFNERPIYRYVGSEEDFNMIATEREFSPLSTTGELFD